MRRLALVLLPFLFAVLAAGVYTIATGRSPRHWFVRAPGAAWTRFDQERDRAAAALPGPYRPHVDPRVGYVMRRETTVPNGRVTATTDALGMRRRSGPPAAANARRFVLLGDSVAFGTGVGDSECLAQQIEDAIAIATGDDGERDLVCVTAAMPGWNWRNAFAFLRDHLDELRPDAVLFLPIGNDLSDGEIADPAGHRMATRDLDNGRPLLTANLNRLQQTILALVPAVERGALELTEEQLGPTALNADLGGESARRYDAMAAGIVALEGELAARGVAFALLQYEAIDFTRALMRRLERAGAKAPWIPLLEEVRAEDTLGDDSHANAATLMALGRWTAAALQELRWFEAPHAVPDAGAAWATRRAPPPPVGAALEALAAADRAAMRALLRDVIEPARGEGLHQVYGGLSPLHLVGPELLVALPRRAGEIEVVLEPIAGRPDLLPLRLELLVEEQRVGELLLPADSTGPTRARFRFAPGGAPRVDGAATETMDVSLRPEGVVAVREKGGFEIGACRLIRLALE